MAGEPDRGGAWNGAGMAWTILGYLVAGIVVWGGIGYLLDRWFGFHWLFLPIGLIVGAGGAIYLIIVRYVRNQEDT